MQQPNSSKLVTIFGGSGFVGKQVVRRLAKEGFRIRVATRYPNLMLSLKPLGDVGQIALVKADIRNDVKVAEAVKGATHVINLTGILRPGGGQSFKDVHVEGASNIANACARHGVTRLIQMSAIGADANSNSQYAKSRAAGEAAVKQAFPRATILRPSVIFGSGDGFFSLFARLMRWFRWGFPMFGSGLTRFQPIYVGDVAEVVAQALGNDRTCGKTYELGGPAIYTFKQILELTAHFSGRNLAMIPVPFILLNLGAAVSGWLPFAPVTLDQARLLRKDNVVKSGPDAASVGTIADFAITPTTVEAEVPGYLYAYRPAGQFIEHGKA